MARMLRHMLKNAENYNAKFYRKSSLLPDNWKITVEQAIIVTGNQGYMIKPAAA